VSGSSLGPPHKLLLDFSHTGKNLITLPVSHYHVPINLTEVYSKFHRNLTEARNNYIEQINRVGESLNKEWEVCLKDSILPLSVYFSDELRRMAIVEDIRKFFRVEDRIPFAAIDGSCYKLQGDRFMFIYGGAFCARGELVIERRGARIIYKRSLEQDVSYVAFIPLPPEFFGYGSTYPPYTSPVSDRDFLESTSMHTWLMQLAEMYAALDLARSKLDHPKLILLDTSLSGLLGNTSFVKYYRSLVGSTLTGRMIKLDDIVFTIAHPFEGTLGVPPAMNWVPHYRIVAELFWRNGQRISYDELLNSMREREVVERGIKALVKMGIARYDEGGRVLELNTNPCDSWEKMQGLLVDFCRALFEQKEQRGLLVRSRSGYSRYLTAREVQFLAGLGLRMLIEECWRKSILLIGVVKDSASMYFFRNYLGSLHVARSRDPGIHASISLSDRSVLELLSQLRDELEAPWSTIEFDSAFTTIRPQPNGSGWAVRGYRDRRGMEFTRTPRLFLKSLAQFLLKRDTGLASHVLFVDRLAYPAWDDRDSVGFAPARYGSGLGSVQLLLYDASSPPRLQLVSMLLLELLVRNIFPEAPGYPEPLHKADLGARAFRDHVRMILESAWRMERKNPLMRTFRSIRDRVIRLRGGF
jgi:hypothetical protein